MKLLFVCVIVATLGFVFPAILTTETSILKNAIDRTFQMVQKRGAMKRDVPAHVQMAFDWIDGNKDGHITAHEFANFYSSNLPQLGLTYDQWKEAFIMAMGVVDTNGNSQLEINEFKSLAESGGL